MAAMASGLICAMTSGGGSLAANSGGSMRASTSGGGILAPGGSIPGGIIMPAGVVLGQFRFQGNRHSDLFVAFNGLIIILQWQWIHLNTAR